MDNRTRELEQKIMDDEHAFYQAEMLKHEEELSALYIEYTSL